MTYTWKLGLAAAALLSFPTLAMADEWTASKLFGQVLQLVDGQWQPVARGDVVPDGRVIRTLGFGRATFTRGGETVDVGANTQIQIFDEKRQKPFTTVKQYFGSVSVEAEVEQVQHFAVQTPYLAAVVKGTRFTVNSGDTGASVIVHRGHVAVEDQHDHTHVLISAGQSAAVKTGDAGGSIEVSGEGALPEVVPTGESLFQTTSSSGKSDKSESSGKGKSGDSGNGNSGSDNSGKSNSGNGNSGNGNSGKGNSGSDNGNSGKGSSGNGKGNSGKGKGNGGNDNGDSQD